MSDSILAAITRISAFSSFTASRTFSTYPLPVAADVSSTLQTYIIGLLVSRYRSFASCWSSGLSNVTVRQLLPSSRVSLYFMSISQSLFALLSPPAFACFCTLASLFSTVSRSLHLQLEVYYFLVPYRVYRNRPHARCWGRRSISAHGGWHRFP